MASADPTPERSPPLRPRTPWSPVPRTNRDNLVAEMNHMNTAAALATRTKDTFLARAQEILADKAAVKGPGKQPKNLWDALVKRADIGKALKELLKIPERAPERIVCPAVRTLLNTISREYNVVVHGPNPPPSTPAVIFSSLHDHTVPGDYLAVKTKPDWQAFMGQHSGLADILKYGQDLIDTPRPHSSLGGVGEDKTDEIDPIGQFKYYLVSTKRFRPDLETVHGFQLSGGQLHIASLNAFGLDSSEAFSRGNLEAWVALVVLLYHSSDTRDERLTYVPVGTGLAASGQWDIRRDPDSQKADFSVFPNYASNAPGRMTWTAFVPGEIETPFRDDFDRRTREAPAVGFLKVSWQRPSVLDAPTKETVPAADSTAPTGPDVAAADEAAVAREVTVEPEVVAAPPLQDAGARPLPKLPLTEGELLHHAHEGGWIPGLVRYHKFPQRDATIETKIGKETHVRFKEILHLASVGEPLSQCDTPQHILEVFYDLVETHLQLLKRDILHRDPSWFNVLCNPEHDPATLNGGKVPLAGIPCIKKIFGDPNGEPACLLIDLDHSAHVDRLWKPGYKTGIERTGTPMFVALELSATGDQCMDYTESPLPSALKKLTAALKAIEAHPDVYREAFPDDSGATFMDDFAEVVRLEQARFMDDPEPRLRSDEDEMHRAHHDMETVYWDLLWTFVRALPKDSDPNSVGTAADNLSNICGQLLKHKLGREAARLPYLQGVRNLDRFLHWRLAHFAGLLESLATYFCIPWHRYLRKGTVKIDHAHHAIRRLLLAEIVFLRADDGKINVKLDKMQPRIFVSDTPGDRLTLGHNEHRGTGHETAGGTKRKRMQGDPNPQAGEPGVKKAKIADAPAEDAAVEKPKVPATKHHPRSARELQNLFYESRLLWFGTGRRK